MRNEARQTLIEFCQENALVIANTLFQQHKRRLYTWTSPDGQHQNQIDYILCSQRWRSSIYSQQKQDQELTVAQIMNSLLPSRFNCVKFCATLWTVPHQAPLSVEFSRQEHWSGLSFPSPGDLPNPGIELLSPALAGGFFSTSATWEDKLTM